MKRPPLFLSRNENLWEAWSTIQARGWGIISRWDDEGWRISTENLPNGSAVMKLEILFDPGAK